MTLTPFFARAVKSRDGGGFLSRLMGGKNLDEASDLFFQAGNQYKLAKKWMESGNAFREAALVKITMNEQSEAASRYVDSANSYKKVSPEDAISALNNAAQLLSENGRRSTAAKHKQTIAQLCKDDLSDKKRAMEYFMEAAEIFHEEDSPSSANSCNLEAGKIAADLEDYQKAIELLENVAHLNVKNSLTRWGAKEYFLMAGICHLAQGDVVGCRQAIATFCSADESFTNQREFALLNNLLDALESRDADLFTDHCKKYDELTKLDSWKTTHLLRAKKIAEAESLT